MADASEMSKSAKRRAAKKARDAAAEEPAPAPPAPAPASTKAAAKSAAGAGYPEPKAKGKAKAKAEPKAVAAPPAPAAPEPKAKAKAKAKAEPTPQPVAATPAPAPEPKSAAKAKAKSQPAGKAKAKAAPKQEEPAPAKVEIVQHFEMDDGTGGDWEVSTGLTAKQKKRMERKEEEKKEMEKLKKMGMGNPGNKHIPGLNMVPEDQKRIPGASQSLTAKPLDIAAMRAEIEAKTKQAATAEAEAPKVEQSVATVKVPTERIGVVIGPKGAKIKMIQEKTETRIDTSDELFTITGPAKGVALAESAVQDLVKKGYTPLQYDDFSENYMQVNVTSLPEIIGSKGATIIKIKDELGVEVNMPTKEEQQGKKCKIGMGGPKDKVEKCKEVIEHILMYGHHEITHPGESHEELEVEDWAYGPIIGPKGCELRHMQKTFQVKVNIPRHDSLNQKVCIVGLPNNVSRCKAHIERIIYNYQNQSKGRSREDAAEDVWGDEEPEEDWMKAYLYKRK